MGSVFWWRRKFHPAAFHLAGTTITPSTKDRLAAVFNGIFSSLSRQAETFSPRRRAAALYFSNRIRLELYIVDGFFFSFFSLSSCSCVTPTVQSQNQSSAASPALN